MRSRAAASRTAVSACSAAAAACCRSSRRVKEEADAALRDFAAHLAGGEEELAQVAAELAAARAALAERSCAC